MFGGTPVEVRKNPKATTWYEAELLDLRGEKARVAFEGDVWPRRDVPAYSVRRRPKDAGDGKSEVEGFDPQADETVEVFVPATESSPSGWSLGRVKTIKNSFYFVGFVAGQRTSQDMIVERNALRPCSNEASLEPAGIVRKLLAVDEDLHEWFRSPDSLGCLQHVKDCAGLLVSTRNNASAEVLLVGAERSVGLAERLLTQIHFPNQLQMQRFHEQRESLLERLADQQQRFSAQAREVFTVDQGLVGKLIGKKGENVRRVRELHGVEISVKDDEFGSQRTTVTIKGDDASAVKSARDELEFVTEKLPLKSEQVGWILGKGYQNIQDIGRKTDLLYARFENAEGCLALCGLKHQVEDARMLIQAHMEYQQVYRNMDEEEHAIRQSFERLDAAAAASGVGGRGGARGRGRGGGVGGGAGESETWGGGKRGGRGRKGGSK